MRRLLLGCVGAFALAAFAAGQADKPKPKGGGKTDPPGVPLRARLIAKQAKYTLDLGGKTSKEYRAQIAAAKQSRQAPPKPPAVDLVLELRNTGAKELQFWVGGDGTNLVLELKGPGGVTYTQDIPLGRAYLPSKKVTLAAGKTHPLPLKSLLTGTSNIKLQRTYWTEKGDYTLVAHYHTAVLPAPKKSKPGLEGFGHVVLTTAPIKLKVVAAK
jgi:hypothetical protein